jgi:hypothetical protein
MQWQERKGHEEDSRKRDENMKKIVEVIERT